MFVELSQNVTIWKAGVHDQLYQMPFLDWKKERKYTVKYVYEDHPQKDEKRPLTIGSYYNRKASTQVRLVIIQRFNCSMGKNNQFTSILTTFTMYLPRLATGLSVKNNTCWCAPSTFRDLGTQENSNFIIYWLKL